MGESSKFPKSWTFETPILKLAVGPLNIHNFNFNGQLSFDRLYKNRKTYHYLPNSVFWGWLSMESQPQNPEFRNNPEFEWKRWNIKIFENFISSYNQLKKSGKVIPCTFLGIARRLRAKIVLFRIQAWNFQHLLRLVSWWCLDIEPLRQISSAHAQDKIHFRYKVIWSYLTTQTSICV